eukprot:498331_1
MSLNISAVKRIQQIDSKHITLVTGYIRQLHLNSFHIIPELVTLKCLLFYYNDHKMLNKMKNVYQHIIGFDYMIDKLQWGSSLMQNNIKMDECKYQTIFNLIDTNNDGLIRKSDFVIFTTQIFDDNTIQELQSLLLKSIDIYYNYTHTAMQRDDGWSKWELEELKRDMKRELRTMAVDDSHKQNNDLYPNKTDALHWTESQISSWMHSIGMNKYIGNILLDTNINGKILLDNDCINVFVLEIDFDFTANDAMQMVKQIDKLNFQQESKWLNISFQQLAMRYDT